MLNGLSTAWSWNPISLLLILGVCLLYFMGQRDLKRRDPTSKLPERRQLIWFSLAIFCLVVVMLTPIDTIARTQMFLVHMAQLVLISTLAVPFLLLGSPHEIVTPLLEKPGLKQIIVSLTNPIVASIIFNLTFLAWHLPWLFSLTQQHQWLYQIELLTIFLASLINWWPLVGPVEDVRGLSYPIKMLYAFLDGLPLEIFAFILVYSGVVLFPLYHVPPILSINPYGDQTAGGALLMIPGLIDLIVMTPLFFRWIAQIDKQALIDDERRANEAAAREAEEGPALGYVYVDEDEDESEDAEVHGVGKGIATD